MKWSLNQIEKIRIKNFVKKKKNNAWILYIKNLILLAGVYVILWYMNREEEKGLLRFQFNKGVCMMSKYKKYNSMFQLRSVIEDVAIEQKFLNFCRFNILMFLKKNPVKRAYKNSLKFLRKKKNRFSQFKVELKPLY